MVEERRMADRILTTVVGSYPQPDWLVDREHAAQSAAAARPGARDLARAGAYLEQAQDDATLLAIRDMERAGIDIITDGEIRRESYSNRFATALDGIDLDNPGIAIDRTGHPEPGPAGRRADPPHATGRGARRRVPRRQHRPAHQDHGARTVHHDAAGAERLLRRRGEARAGLAAAVNEEIEDLFAAGADVVQIDEPYLQARPEKARAAMRVAGDRSRARRRRREPRRCTSASATPHIVHDRPERLRLPARAERDAPSQQISLETAQPNLDLSVLRELPDKTIILGVLDLGSMTVETPERSPRAFATRYATSSPRAPDRRARLRDEVPAARRRLRQAPGDGRGRRHRQ